MFVEFYCTAQHKNARQCNYISVIANLVHFEHSFYKRQIFVYQLFKAMPVEHMDSSVVIWWNDSNATVY